MIAFVASLLSLIVACVTLVLTVSVFRIVNSHRKRRRHQAQIHRDHAEFLKGLAPTNSEVQVAPAQELPAVTVNGKTNR
jgi:hypothetical protein